MGDRIYRGQLQDYVQIVLKTDCNRNAKIEKPIYFIKLHSILPRFIVFNEKLCEASFVILPLPPFFFNGSYCAKDSFNYDRWNDKSGFGCIYKGCDT